MTADPPEEELGAEVQRFMLEEATDVLFLLGVEASERYRFLWVNPSFCVATGLRREEVVGHTVEAVIPEPSVTLVRANYAKAIRARETVRWDEATKYPAGEKWGEVSITPVFGSSGKCTHLVGRVRDVTERRQNEERLAAQAALLDRANDCIIVRRLDGVVEYWNQGAERVFGWSAGEVVGRNMSAVLYRNPAVLELAEKELLEKGAWAGELGAQTKAGEPIILRASWTRVRNERGGSDSIFIINQDITEQKSLEAQLYHTQRLQSMGLLAGGIAHDFNNLLAAVTLNAEVAKQALEEDHPVQLRLAEIERASSRAGALARRLLSFSRQQEPKREPVDLGALAGEVLGLLRPMLARREVQLQTQIDTDVPEICADPTQIHQVVLNLAANAAEAMNDGERVLEVRVERAVLTEAQEVGETTLRPGTYGRLVVADTGSGMDQALLDHIFEPFFSTKPLDQGTGLGLSVVNGIMQSHEGAIAVKSEPGRGTEFTLYFPAVGSGTICEPSAP